MVVLHIINRSHSKVKITMKINFSEIQIGLR